MYKNNDKFFFDLVIKNKIYYKRRFNQKKSIQFFLERHFSKIAIEDKKVIDIGGGAGLLSFYSWFKRAKYTLCLEPEMEGSTKGFINNFNLFKTELGAIDQAIEIKNLTFQDYIKSYNKRFDVVILFNSINHLNEEACEKLLFDENSQIEYNKIFEGLFELTEVKGQIIISDCSRINFFNSLGLKNPFARSIEWQKHQSPYIWKKYLEESGFKNVKISWPAHEYLGLFGDFLFSNRIISFFTFSNFRIVADKV